MKLLFNSRIEGALVEFTNTCLTVVLVVLLVILLVKMRRSQRTSAVKAKERFRDLEDNDDEEVVVKKEEVVKNTRKKPEPKTSKAKNRRKKSNDEDYVVEEESSDEVIAESAFLQKDSLIDAAILSGSNPIAMFPSLKEYSNWQQRKRKALIESWKDYLIKPTVVLRDFPKGITSSWKKTVAEHGSVSCPYCEKSFTTYAGMSYHYRRCGIDVNPGGVCCKLCGYRDVSDKKLLPHMSTHLDQLPKVSDQLKLGLVYAKDVKDNAQGRTSPDKSSSDKSSKATRKPTTVVREKIVEGQDYVQTALEYRLKMERRGLFGQFMPDLSSWVLISEEEYQECLPRLSQSCSFKEGQEDWRSLDLFKSCGKSFFVGGSVWASAWLPIPSTVKDYNEEVLALAVGLSVDDTHVFAAEAEKGLLQFWVFEDNSQPISAHLSFCITHVYAVVWGMEWTPFGNSWNEERLGLLGLACGDGHVRLLSIPHLKSLESLKSNKADTNQVPIFRVEPVLDLDPPCQGFICRCISWSKWHDNSLIAGGYGNGVIGVWDLNSKSMKECINGHPSAVTCLSFCPEETPSPVLASGGHLDKNVFIWDLKRLPFPLQVTKKSIVRDIKWIMKGIIVCLEDCFASGSSTSIFVPIEMKDFSSRVTTTLNAHKSTVWSCSYNDWSNSTATVDAAGEAVVFKDMALACKKPRGHSTTVLAKFPIFRSRLELLSQDKNDKTVHRSYKSMASKYGIVFEDSDVSSCSTFKQEDMMRVHNSSGMSSCHPSNYPLTALTHVEWNPNQCSFDWLLTTGQTGLCRLIHCSFVREAQKAIKIPFNKNLENQEESETEEECAETDFYVLPDKGIEVVFVPDNT